MAQKISSVSPGKALTQDEIWRDNYLRIKTTLFINNIVVVFVYLLTRLMGLQGIFIGSFSPGNTLLIGVIFYIVLIWGFNEYQNRVRSRSPAFHLYAVGIGLYFCNLVSLTVLVHYTGGAQSLYSLLYIVMAWLAAFMSPLKLVAPLAALGVMMHGILLWLTGLGILTQRQSGLFIFSGEISTQRATVLVFLLNSILTFLFVYFGWRFNRMFESQRKRMVEDRVDLEKLVEDRTRDLTGTLDDLRAANVSLDREKRRQERFFAHLTHQFRTPIHIINNFVSNFFNGIYGSITPRQIEALYHLSMCSQNLLNLINNLLDMAKIHSRKMEYQAEPYILDAELEKIVRVTSPLAQTRGVSIHWELAQDVPQQIMTDRVKLEAILSNLIQNAVKYSKNKPVYIRVFTEKDYDGLVFHVEDYGKGIPQEHLTKIFEAFEQSTASKEFRGSGLGLYISRTFAKIMGGELRVFSEMGRGSIFELRLPDTIIIDQDNIQGLLGAENQ